MFFNFKKFKFFEIEKHFSVKSHGKEAFKLLDNNLIVVKNSEGFFFEKDF